MSLLRAIRDDFVEQRLWPIAVVLAIALVAVPVALGRGGADPVPAPPSPAQLAAPATVPDTTVALITKPRQGKARGKAGDPFVPRTAGGAKTASAASAPASAGVAVPVTGGSVGGSSAASGGSSGATSTPRPLPSAPGAPRTAPRAPAPAGAAAGYRVDLRFGEVGDTDVRTDVTRLAPLNAPAGAVAILLGVLSDGKTAVFAIAGETEPTGDGRCLPSAETCRVIELEAGETARFRLAGGSHELELLRVARKREPSAARAASALRRESRAGRRVLRALIADGRLYVGRYAYVRDRGALVRQAG